MTRRNFRDLLLIYLLVVILTAAYGMYVGVTVGTSAGELVSEVNTNENLKKDMNDIHKIISNRQSTSSLIATVSLLLVIISWVGLFKFWRPARITFCVYLLIAYLIEPFFDLRFDELPVENQLFDFYCKILLSQPESLAKIVGTIITAFDTFIVVTIFSIIGRDLFKPVENEINT